MKQIIRISLVAVLSFILNTAFSQTVHRISNDAPDAIKSFVEDTTAWSAGDTIMLVSSGVYLENVVIDIFQDVTIMGDPSLAIQPEIHFEDTGFRVKADNISVTLKNFKANGFKTNGGNAGYLLYWNFGGGPKWKDILVEDVEAYGFIGGVQLNAAKHKYFKSVKLNRVFFHDLNVNTKSWALEPYQNVVEHLEITNSTFANIFGVLKNVEPDAAANADSTVGFKVQNIFIYRNTFYNVAGDGGALVQLNDPTDGSVKLNMNKNIVSTLLNSDRSRPFLLGANAGEFTISDNGFHNFRSARVDNGASYNLDYLGKQTNVTVSDTLTDDPKFTKTDTIPYNFSMPLNSPYDGYGDPRWQSSGSGVSISPLSSTLMVGNKATLSATVTLPDGSDLSVTWSVVDGTGSATINATTGEITAVTAGTVKVTATSKHDTSLSDELEITIEAAKTVATINLVGKNAFGTETNKITSKGGSISVFATVLPADAVDRSITWSLSDSNLAEIQSSDNTKVVLKALASGTVTVTATANDASGVMGTFDVIMSNQRPVESITVTAAGDATEVLIGETLQMSAEVLPADADVSEVIWSVDKANIATIDAEGKLTAVAAGVVTVKASANDDSFEQGTLQITVIKATPLETINSLATLYPNPTVSSLNLNISGNAKVEIVSMTGQILISRHVTGSSSFDVSTLKSGMYLMRIATESGIENMKFRKL